jgi:hypothetical protein
MAVSGCGFVAAVGLAGAIFMPFNTLSEGVYQELPASRTSPPTPSPTSRLRRYVERGSRKNLEALFPL